MHKRKLTVAILGGLAVTAMTMNLTACGGGGGNGAVKPSTPVAPTVTNYNENVATGSTSTIGDDLDGAGNMTLTGGGTLVLTGTNTFTGGTTITSSTLQLGNGGTTGSIVGDVADNGTLVFDRSDDITFDGIVSGTGALVQAGTGTLALTGENTFTGGTTISAGTLQLGNGGTTGSIVGDVTDNAALVFDRSDALTYAGVISGTGSLTQAGTGTLTLTGKNTYTGTTTISSGTLALAGDGSIASVLGIDIHNAGVLDISGATGGASIASLSDDGTGDGSVVLGGNTLTLTNAFSNPDFSGTISGNGGLAIAGGSLELDGANTYTGLTTIDAGAALQVGGGGTGGSIAGDIVDNGSLKFDRSDVLSYGGVISGAGSVMQAGKGTLVFAGDNTYSGDTEVGATSTLQLGNGGTSGSIVGNVEIDGTLVFDHSDAVTYGGAVTGSGSLMKVGSGTLTLTGMNAYDGGITIDAGTMALVGNVRMSGLPFVDVEQGGTLDVSGVTGNTIVSGLQGSGSVELGGNTLGFLGAQAEFDGAIGGSGGLDVSISSLKLGGTNTYTGQTSIDVTSTLALVGDGSIADSSGVVLNVGSAFDISGTNSGATIKSLTGLSGSALPTVALGGQTLTVTDGGDFNGIIGGTGGLVVSGGTLRLDRANTYTGLTTIDPGAVLQLGDGMNNGLIAGSSIVDNGSLAFSWAYGTTTYGGVISGTGSVVVNIMQPGTLQLTGANTYTGDTIIDSGVLQSTHPLHGNVTVKGVLDGVPEVDGNLANTGSVNVHGGDTTVTGNYTQTDPKAYDSSYLAVSLGSKLAVTGTATLNGGTLEVTGADSGYVANSHTDVLTATGGVSGTFDQLLKAGVVFASTTIGYGANDVYLDTTGLNITVAAHAMGIVDPASVGAAQRVEAGFESINRGLSSGGQLSSGILQGAGDIQHSATPAIAHASLQSLSGQLHAASAAMLFDGIDASGNAVTSHFDDLLAGRVRSGVWESNLGAQGNLQRSGYAGATFSSSGVMAGADMRIGTHAVLGVAAGQSRGFGQLDAAWDHNRTSMENVGVYGGLVNGPWYANARVATGWYREDMQRLVQLGSFGAPVGSGFTGRYVAGSLEGGRMFNVGMTRVVPFVDVRYQSLNLGGFAEQGAMGFGLEAGARTAGRLQTGVGLRAARSWRLANGMRLGFDGSAGWRHTLHQYGSVFDASFTGFSNWLPVEGVGLSRDTTVLRAGLSIWPSRNFGLRLGFTREQGQRQDANSALLQGVIRF